MAFELKIYTNKGLHSSVSIDSLTINMISGYRTILTGHADLIGALTKDLMYYYQNNKKEQFIIFGGVLKIDNGNATILTDEIYEVKDLKLDDLNKELEVLKVKVEEDKLDEEKAIINEKISRLEETVKIYKNRVNS